LNIFVLRQLQRSGRRHNVFGLFLRPFVRPCVRAWNLNANISRTTKDIDKW